jgi:tetratricopeptide (TPR) repeat protein
MRRTLNVRFALTLAAAALLLGCGLYVFHGVQQRRMLDAIRREAQKAEAEGRHEQAARCLARYLRYRPDDRDALALYAVVLDESARSPDERRRALQVLDRVLAQRPLRHDLRKRFVRRAMEEGQFSAARRHLELLLQAARDDGAVEHQLGQCYAADKNFAVAAEWFTKAVQHAPGQVNSYVQLAALLQDHLGQSEQVPAVLDALVAANPKSFQAYLARARYRQAFVSAEAAWADVVSARALAPREFEVLALAAEIALARGQLDEARSCLEKCLPLQPPRATWYLLRAAVEQQAGQRAQAVAILRQGVEALPSRQRNPLLLRLADVLLQDRQTEQAQAVVRQLRKSKAAAAQVDLLEARLLVQQGQWQQAAATLQRTSSQLSALAEVNLAAQLLLVAETPRDYRPYLGLGRTLWTVTGPSPEVEATFRQGLALSDHAADAVATLVQYLVRTGHKDGAEAVVAQARADLPPDRALVVLPYCHEILGRVEEADRGYQAALAAKNPPAFVFRQAADFYLRHNQFARAAPHLRKLLETGVDVPEADLLWARRNLAIGLAVSGGYPGFQEALALLDETTRAGKTTRDDLRAAAVVLAQHPSRRADAIHLFEDLRTGAELSGTDLFLLAQLYEANRDWAKARPALLAVLAVPGGKTPAAVANVLRALLQHGETEPATALLTELEQLEPGTFRTVALRALVLNAEGKRAAAVELLEKFADRKDADLGLVAAALEEMAHPDAADALLTRWVTASQKPGALLARAAFLGRQQRLAEAFDVCERVWQSCPAEQVAGLCTALLHQDKAGAADRKRVEQWLTAALVKTPDALPLLLALADVCDGQGRPVEAAALYRRVLAADPNNVVGLNNLAWLLARERRRTDEALALVNRAIDAHGPLGQLLDTRAVIYLATGQTTLAVPDLEAALAQQPTAGRHFHLAQAYWLAGSARAAARFWRLARSENLTLATVHASERELYLELLGEFGRRE